MYSAQPGADTHHISMSREDITVEVPQLLDTAALRKDGVAEHGVSAGLLGPNAALVSSGGISGTAVVLDNIDRVWFRSLTERSIAAEVEHHFESLLRRDGLTVTVSSSGSTDSVRCMPFDYGQIEGHHIEREIEVAGGHAPVQCKFIVSKRVVDKKRPRFFKQGRCIGPVADIQSFIKHSVAGDELWGHPALSG